MAIKILMVNVQNVRRAQEVSPSDIDPNLYAVDLIITLGLDPTGLGDMEQKSYTITVCASTQNIGEIFLVESSDVRNMKMDIDYGGSKQGSPWQTASELILTVFNQDQVRRKIGQLVVDSGLFEIPV